jgi:K+-transporting ATPase ATPase B chain
VKYRPISATRVLTLNMVIYGIGGIIIPFIGIKLIDILLVSTHMI